MGNYHTGHFGAYLSLLLESVLNSQYWWDVSKKLARFHPAAWCSPVRSYVCEFNLESRIKHKLPHLALRHFYFSEPVIQAHDLLRQSHVTIYELFLYASRNLFRKCVSNIVHAHGFVSNRKRIHLNWAHMGFMRILEILLASGVSTQGFFCVCFQNTWMET